MYWFILSTCSQIFSKTDFKPRMTTFRMRTVWALSVVHTYVCVCVCSGGGCWAELQSAGNSLLLQSMWLTVCGREGNCWSMPVVTRAFRGADVEQTEAHRTHREGAGSPELMTHLSQTIPSCLFTLLFCSLSKSADRQGTVTQWLGRLKGFHLFRLQDKRLI